MRQSLTIFMTDIKTPKNHIILVPIDFSQSSENALDYAVEVAKLFDSQITLIHVYSNSVKTMFLNDEQKRLIKEGMKIKMQTYHDDIKAKLPNVEVNIEIVDGKPYKQINQMAESTNCDTIVMGTNGVSGIEQFTGSTTSRVLRSSPVPVIVVKDHTTKPTFNDIILPIDLTKSSKQKVVWAAKIAKIYNSRIHVIMEVEKDEFIKKKVDLSLKQVESFLTDNNVNYITKLLDDSTYPDHIGMDTIKYADEVNADLIMIMTQAEGSIGEMFLGSYAQQIVNSAQKTPVMCINPKKTFGYAGGGEGFY